MQSSRIPPRPAALSVHAVVALCVLTHTALTGSRVTVSLSALAMGASAFQLGLLLAVYALLPTLGSVWLGRWIDRAGARVPALAGMAATCVGLVLPAWQLTPATLWLTAVLVGGGYTASLLALQSLLGRHAENTGRPSGFSGFALGAAISSILGPLLAGQCLALAGARLTFALLAGVALAAWVGAILWRRGLDGRSERRVAAPRGRLSLRQVLDDPALRRILVVDLLIAVAWNANSFIVPVYGTQHGWSAAAVGNVLATFGGAVLLVRVLPEAWRQRLGDWRMIRLALASSGVCFLLFPFADQLTFAFVLEFVMGLGLGGSLPSLLALMHAQSPAGRDGEVLGLRLVALNLSAVLLPMCLGGLGATLGLASVMWSLGAGLSFGAASKLAQHTRPARPSSRPGAGYRQGGESPVPTAEKERPTR